MKWKKIIKRTLLVLLVIAVGYAVYYAWFSFPIITGYSAKNACSCVFLQGRTKEDVMKEELASFPLSAGSININFEDSSVTGTVLGMAERKAIFRNGLGCTLVNNLSEAEIRSQVFTIPQPVFTQDSIAWPSGDKLTGSPVNSSINRTKLDTAISFVFNHRYKNKEVYTRALLVVHNGAIVAEQYAPGYNKTSRFLGWSMAKSVTSALTGILVKVGKLAVSQPAPVSTWKKTTDKRHSISVENLLQQTSGLDFLENYSSYSNVTNMLFNEGDMAGYTSSLPLKDQPGSLFYYSSGNSNILSGIVRSSMDERQYPAFPYTALFHKIGMNHTLLEPDASGTFVGSSYVYASARDYARFGLLYLNDGVWNGERILPEGWVQRTITPPSSNKLKNYGYQFWLNGLDKDNTSKREYPEMPTDMFLADGYGGQRIYIIPSLQLVIVRMGLNMFDEHGFLNRVMEALK